MHLLQATCITEFDSISSCPLYDQTDVTAETQFKQMECKPTKRRCQIIHKADLLTSFEVSTSTLLNRYEIQSEKLIEDGLSILQDIARTYFAQKQPLSINNLKEVIEYKEIIPDTSSYAKSPPRSPKKQHVDFSAQKVFPSAVKGPQQQSIVHNDLVFDSQQESTQQSLVQQLKRISLEPQDNQDLLEGLHQDQQNETNFDEHIVCSSKKVQQQSVCKEIEPNISDNDSDEYPMTDYSSNESSNEHSYAEEFKEEIQEENIFGPFLKPGAMQPVKNLQFNLASVPSNNGMGQFVPEKAYRPLKQSMKQLLLSPKKEKDAYKKVRRRLYIRNKKVPSWAEDMAEVGRLAAKQQKDPNLDWRRIYGVCIVEELNTNVMFKTEEAIGRRSSGIWNSQFDNFF